MKQPSLRECGGNGERRVWIVIDDLDATFQNTPVELLNLSTFFSACRYLTQDLSGINFRISMRTDVWPLIRRYDESLDKMEQYVSEILWTRKDFLKLLSLRVKVNLGHAGFITEETRVVLGSPQKQESLLENVFVSKMRWGEREEDTYKVIFTLAYERPRWAIQLCKLAKDAAVRRGDTHISKTSIDDVWASYGYKRIADLVAEHKHQCPEVEELANAFRGADRQLTTEALFTWINNHIVNHIDAVIEGSRTRSTREIARFMYRIGFIIARSDGETGYEHYRFD